MNKEIQKKYKEVNVMSVTYIQRKYKLSINNASEVLKYLATNKCRRVYIGKKLVQIYR